MRLLIFAMLVCGTAGAQTTAMYRTVSPDGTVTFSDVPLSDDSEMITVLVRSGATRTQEENSQRETERANESIAAQTADNCALAREQQQSLANSTRLYRVLPSGERQFLTDDEVAAAREKAAADVAQLCRQPG